MFRFLTLDMSHFGRNIQCPCGSGLKYKKCCLNKVDWDRLIKGPSDDFVRQLTLRGKNLAFASSMLGALQHDGLKPGSKFSEFKRAFTPQAVKSIYQSVYELWPSIEDYERCHIPDQGTTTALYTGSYEPDAVFKALTRHSLYSERIYLVDPFLNPRRLNDEFNPMLHPEEHRGNAVKFAYLWLKVLPWIEAGIVNFIRSPKDYIPQLEADFLDAQRKRFENPELKELAEKHAAELMKQMSPRDRGMGEHYYLSHPDEWHIEQYQTIPGEKPPVDELLKHIKWRRENHPYYIARLPGQKSEFIHHTSGANYEEAKHICGITKSHLITDLETRWKEIELDRSLSSEKENWGSFAKALQNSNLKVLNDVDLDAALKLRQEKRLDSMRNFFHRVWKNCKDADSFSNANADSLTAELDDQIANAQAEWSKIDQELVSWFGATGGSLIATGLVGFVPAAVGACAVGTVGLIQAKMKRISFKNQLPSGFFLTLKKS